jgi:hypothetical protein
MLPTLEPVKVASFRKKDLVVTLGGTGTLAIVTVKEQVVDNDPPKPTLVTFAFTK